MVYQSIRVLFLPAPPRQRLLGVYYSAGRSILLLIATTILFRLVISLFVSSFPARYHLIPLYQYLWPRPSIKMSIILYLPGILLVLVKQLGLVQTFLPSGFSSHTSTHTPTSLPVHSISPVNFFTNRQSTGSSFQGTSSSPTRSSMVCSSPILHRLRLSHWASGRPQMVALSRSHSMRSSAHSPLLPS